MGMPEARESLPESKDADEGEVVGMEDDDSVYGRI
jgi:hypothetical protein